MNKIKRLTALCLAVLLAVCLPVPARADAEQPELAERYLWLRWNGCAIQANVLQDADGTIYAPISWLTYYGLMACRETEERYEYYYPSQQQLDDYAKRIFIDRESGVFSVRLYFNAGTPLDSYVRQYDATGAYATQAMTEEQARQALTNMFGSMEKAQEQVDEQLRSSFVPLFTRQFSAQKSYNDEQWVPLTELLPLLNATVFVSDDGFLNIRSNVLSIYEVLYRDQLRRTLLFDAKKDIVGSGVINVGGLVVDSFFETRLDRLDFVTNRGRQEDYEELFKDFLVDNEVYLSSGGSRNEMLLTNVDLAKDIAKLGKTAADYLKDAYSLAEDLYLDMYALPDVFQLIDPDTKKMIGSKLISAGKDMFEYLYTYYDQVQDHRRMLGAVYGYNDQLADTPSYRAAMRVQDLYSDQIADRLVAGVWEGIEDEVAKKIDKAIEDNLFPRHYIWELAYDMTDGLLKTFLGHDTQFKEVFKNGAMLDLMQNAVDISYKTYDRRRDERTFTAQALDDLRLSGLMALVSSKFAYETMEVGSQFLPEVEQVMADFYRASDSVTCEAVGYYDQTLKALNQAQSAIKLYGNFAAPTSAVNGGALLTEKIEDSIMMGRHTYTYLYDLADTVVQEREYWDVGGVSPSLYRVTDYSWNEVINSRYADVTYTDEFGGGTNSNFYEYDSAGNLVSSTVDGVEVDYTYEYDDAGRIVGESAQSQDGGWHTVYHYDGEGRLDSSEKQYDWGGCEIDHYDEYGNVREIIFPQVDMNTGETINETQTQVNTYNEQGDLVESVLYAQDGSTMSSTSYTYAGADGRTLTQEENWTLLRDYWTANVNKDCPAVRFDVTGDGLDDVVYVDIVPKFDDGWSEQYTGYVLSVKDGVVRRVNILSGANYGMSAPFELYVGTAGDGQPCLIAQDNAAWQGVGTISFSKFRLDGQGRKVTLESVGVGEGYTPTDNGFIRQEDLDAFDQMASDFLAGATTLYIGDSGMAVTPDISAAALFGTY